MQFEGAVLREQGQTFAVVIVKKSVVDDRTQAAQAIQSFGMAFPGLPVVLMAQDSYGRAEYYGRRDIANFLASVSVSRIPWRKYTLN